MSSRKPTNTSGNSEKRTAQIRAAQRAYRERKENHVKSLEDQVAALKVQVSLLSQPQPQDIVALIEKVAALEQSNMRLKEKVSELQEKSNRAIPSAISPQTYIKMTISSITSIISSTCNKWECSCPSQEVSTASSIVSSTGSSTSVAISTAPVPEYGQPYYLPDSGGYGIIKTAVEMYGIPDYEYALKAIKELPSMKD
ncbi:hypothetical protein BDR26DRAFT_930593 [Obelidium mucronatum]|nr:hypothetical protein BDR26DRAFT_930593 [Obelidium mucronatum]